MYNEQNLYAIITLVHRSQLQYPVKYVKGITHWLLTDNQKPNSKSFTISKVRLHAPATGITTQGSLLYTMQKKMGLHRFKDHVVDYITASRNTSESHSQKMVCDQWIIAPSGFLLWFDVGVHDYGLGFVPRFTYKGSEKSLLNVHLWLLHRKSHQNYGTISQTGKIPDSETRVQ